MLLEVKPKIRFPHKLSEYVILAVSTISSYGVEANALISITSVATSTKDEG